MFRLSVNCVHRFQMNPATLSHLDAVWWQCRSIFSFALLSAACLCVSISTFKAYDQLMRAQFTSLIYHKSFQGANDVLRERNSQQLLMFEALITKRSSLFWILSHLLQHQTIFQVVFHYYYYHFYNYRSFWVQKSQQKIGGTRTNTVLDDCADTFSLSACFSVKCEGWSCVSVWDAPQVFTCLYIHGGVCVCGRRLTGLTSRHEYTATQRPVCLPTMKVTDNKTTIS